MILSVIIFVNRDWVMRWLEHGDTAYWPLLLSVAVILGIVPVVPFGLVSSVLGIKITLEIMLLCSF